MFKRGREQQDVAEVLFDPSSLDLVSLVEDGSAIELSIVAAHPWTGSDAQIRSLQDKINSYVSFAADGQLEASYPEATSLPWRIVLRCQVGPPDARTADVLARTREPVQRYGGDLVIT